MQCDILQAAEEEVDVVKSNKSEVIEGVVREVLDCTRKNRKNKRTLVYTI